MDSFKVLEVKQSIFENNDADAKLLREQLRRDRTFFAESDVFSRLRQDDYAYGGHSEAEG